MITPIPEPVGDIRAQLAAVMDASHPKKSCFVVAADVGQIPYVLNAFYEARPEGTLVTTDEHLADVFKGCSSEADAFDEAMAGILGYPEAKPLVVLRCNGNPAANARAVQARDAEGNVVTEAFASPIGLAATEAALAAHVPPGGELVVLAPSEAISRRMVLRQPGDLRVKE